MARVPTYDSFQVGAEVLPQPRMQSPVALDTAGQQARQMGAALGNTGNELAKMALDMQRQINQVRVDEALNKAKETALRLTFDKDTGYTMLKGNKALERPDGQSLEQEYGDQLQRSIDDIAAGLGNDAQRQVFMRQATGMAANFRGDVLKHATQEYVTHALSIAEGVQATAMREIALSYDKPEVIKHAVLRIQGQVARQAELTGKSAEWQEATRRKMTSEAHKLAAKTALERGHLAYVKDYLKKYEDQLDADDYLALQGALLQESELRNGTAMGAEIGQGLVSAGGGGIDQVFPYLLRQESGNRQFDKSGKVITSSAGALGAAQIMPGTGPEAARLAGLPWDANRLKSDYNYNVALGQAYLKEQYRQFGSVPLALAAYNAGPGAVRRALKKAGAGGNWLVHLPSETQNYVASITGRMNRAARRAPLPTAADVEQNIAANPVLAANPKMARYARKEAERQIKVARDTARQQEDEAKANALRELLGNGGRFSELPFAVRDALSPEDQVDLMNKAERIAKGDDVSNMALYNHFIANPQELAKLSDDQFFMYRTEFSENDFRFFAKERAKLRNPTGADGKATDPGDLNSTSIKQTLDTRLRTMGIDPSPKEGDSDAQRIGAMRQFVNQYLLAQQQQAGKKFNDAEIEKHIDGLFMKSATVRGWFSVGSKSIMAVTPGDMDDRDRQALLKAFRDRGIKPTDGQLMAAYWHYKARKQ